MLQKGIIYLLLSNNISVVQTNKNSVKLSHPNMHRNDKPYPEELIYSQIYFMHDLKPSIKLNIYRYLLGKYSRTTHSHFMILLKDNDTIFDIFEEFHSYTTNFLSVAQENKCQYEPLNKHLEDEFVDEIHEISVLNLNPSIQQGTYNIHLDRLKAGNLWLNLTSFSCIQLVLHNHEIKSHCKRILHINKKVNYLFYMVSERMKSKSYRFYSDLIKLQTIRLNHSQRLLIQSSPNYHLYEEITYRELQNGYSIQDLRITMKSESIFNEARYIINDTTVHLDQRYTNELQTKLKISIVPQNTISTISHVFHHNNKHKNFKDDIDTPYQLNEICLLSNKNHIQDRMILYSSTPPDSFIVNSSRRSNVVVKLDNIYQNSDL
ncbi:unnamed protein product [Heterobilharzia americana]|nr:unnamed protein product [Heterobilharzia americana]